MSISRAYLREAELWVDELVPPHQSDAQFSWDHLAARLDSYIISLACVPAMQVKSSMLTLQPVNL